MKTPISELPFKWLAKHPRAISVLFIVFMAGLVFAANPTFLSFDNTQFATSGTGSAELLHVANGGFTTNMNLTGVNQFNGVSNVFSGGAIDLSNKTAVINWDNANYAGQVSCFITNQAQNVIEFFMNGANQMAVINGGGQLRNNNSITLDWQAHTLLGANWVCQTRFSATASFASGLTTPPTVISVTASPFTYTAGAVNEDVIIQGGTVSSIVWAGTSLPVAFLTGLNTCLPLGAGQTIVVTYTVAPNMVTKVF